MLCSDMKLHFPQFLTSQISSAELLLITCSSSSPLFFIVIRNGNGLKIFIGQPSPSPPRFLTLAFLRLIGTVLIKLAKETLEFIIMTVKWRVQQAIELPIYSSVCIPFKKDSTASFTIRCETRMHCISSAINQKVRQNFQPGYYNKAQEFVFSSNTNPEKIDDILRFNFDGLG